ERQRKRGELCEPTRRIPLARQVSVVLQLNFRCGGGLSVGSVLHSRRFEQRGEGHMRPPSDGSDALGSCEGAAACRPGGRSLVGRDRRLTRGRENSFFSIESSSCRASLFVGQKTEPLGEREQTTQRIVLAQQQTELGSRSEQAVGLVDAAGDEV